MHADLYVAIESKLLQLISECEIAYMYHDDDSKCVYMYLLPHVHSHHLSTISSFSKV